MNLLVDHWASLFGYRKDLKESSDALGLWWQAGYELRNRVVHAGEEPTEEATLDAVNAADALFRDLGSRLRADSRVEPNLPQIPLELRRRAEAERTALTNPFGPHA